MKSRSFEKVIWNRRWLVLAVLVVAVIFSPKLKQLTTPTYSAVSEITYVGTAANAVMPPEDLPQLALSSTVMQRAVADGHLNIEPSDLLRKLTVRESPHSDIIPVEYRSKDSVFAMNVANAVADATVAEYKRLATRQYDQVADKLEAQLADLRGRVTAYNARFQSAVHADPMASTTSGIDSLAARLDLTDQARAAAQAKLAGDLASASNGDTTSAGFKNVIKEETLARDPAYTALTAAAGKDLADYETTKAGYTDAYPGLAGLKEKVGRESVAVSNEAATAATLHQGASPTYGQLLLSQKAAQSLVAADKAQLASLDHQYAQVRSRLDDLPRLTVPADDLRLQRDGASAAYTQVETRLRSTLADKAMAGSLNSIVVLDHATSAAPNMSAPVAGVILVALVFAMAIGAAYLAELLDPRVRTRADVENLYGTPLIGQV